MANRFLVAGGTGNWNSTTNWASTSGGASGASFPVAGDVVALDSNSGNAPLTVNVASACASFVMSGTYAGTLTFNSTLTLTSNCTFLAGCTIAGTAGTLIMSAFSATLTSGGKVLTCALTFAGSSPTYTLADNWSVNGLVTAGVTTSTCTINGAAKTLTCSGGLSHAGTTAVVTGTAKIVLGGGTWSSTSTGALQNSVDLAGTVTISGAVAWGQSGSTLARVSGTITTTGSTLTCIASTLTFDTAGMTWNNVTFSGSAHAYTSAFDWSGTFTCSANMTWTGAAVSGTGGFVWTGTTLTLNNTGGLVTTGTLTLPNAAATFAGSAGFTVGTLTTATLTATRVHTLAAGNVYTVTTALSNNGATTAIRQSLKSSSAGVRAIFTVLAGAVLSHYYCDPTDIDSSLGATVVSINCVIANSLNWSNSSTGRYAYDRSLFLANLRTH